MPKLISWLRARGVLPHVLCLFFGFGALALALALSALGGDTPHTISESALESSFSESTLSESTLSESLVREADHSGSSFSEFATLGAITPLILDALLGFAFCCLFVALFLQLYGIFRIKKQAQIKAYFKPNSLLHRYFGRFFIAKVLALFAALLGAIPLFFMLIFPNEAEILALCLLLPCSVYGFKAISWLLKANISHEFAPLLAKKYTALVCGLLASLLCVGIGGEGARHYESLEQLLVAYHIGSFGALWQEVFGFVLAKQYVFASLYKSLEAVRWAQIGLDAVAFCALGASFGSFCLLVLGCVGSGSNGDRPNGDGLDSEFQSSSESRLDSETPPNAAHPQAFSRFFATLFFLIFLGLAFVASALCVKLLHALRSESTPAAPSLYESLSLGFMRQNARYIEVVLENTRHFVKESELGALESGLGRNLADFESALNRGTDEILEEFFAQREIIIDKYAKWYFSVYGEYTRLFYAAVGKGEEIAQEQFIFLLKAHTPFDLQQRLEALYKSEILNLNARVKQSLELHSHAEAKGEVVERGINLGDFMKESRALSLRLSDKISATLGLSLAGALVLKSGAKALSKSGAKLVGKSVVKKGASSAVGAAGGSLVCGAFAPLCAVGLYVASDYALNSVDKALNEEDFKAEMRKGLAELELQLKTSLYEYNSTLSKQLSNALPLGTGGHNTKDINETN